MKQNCYICGKEMTDWQHHFFVKHPNFMTKAIQRYKNADYDFYDKEFPEKREQLHRVMAQSCVIPNLTPMVPVSEIDNVIIDRDVFPLEFENCLTTIRRVVPEVIPFDSTARYNCDNCSGSCHKRFCPPFIASTQTFREWVTDFESVLVFVWQSDGLAGWTNKPDGMGKRYWGKGLIGADMGMACSAYRTLEGIWSYNKKQGWHSYVAPPGPCKRCSSQGGCVVDGRCRKPHKFVGGITPEAMGIDVITLLKGMDIPIQIPVFEFCTKVALVFLSHTPVKGDIRGFSLSNQSL